VFTTSFQRLSENETMLKSIDRLQLAAQTRVPDPWISLLGAELVGEDRVEYLAAKRTTLRLGQGYIELLEPDGVGPITDAVAERGAHLFASGATTEDFDGLMAHLQSQGITPIMEGGIAYLDGDQTGGFGLRLVISKHADLPSVGDIDFLYETSLLVDDAEQATAHIAKLLALDADNFVAINSTRFEYTGYLTLFTAGVLHRFEIIAPSNPANTMGRFHARNGQGYYMCYAETGELLKIEQRVIDAETGHTSQRPDGQKNPDVVFIHHTALAGMMLGLSRRSQAWTWSGSLERVEPAE
jgi:hypothetical protein